MDFLPDLLKSIMSQTYRDFNVLVIDNGSSDGLEAFLQKTYPQVTLIRNVRNLGFSAAHNQGVRYALEHWGDLQDRFVLVTNPDVILTKTFLTDLLAETQKCPGVGTFGGKLLRAFGENFHDEVMRETILSDRIDSTGLRGYRNRTFTDRGAGELDEGQYDEMTDVFGVSGALSLYRAQALIDVRYRDEFFDHDFFAYKEDVDMAWRLQHKGWKALYVPEALAYHYRGMYGPEQMGILQRLKNRRGRSSLRNFYSSRNHWLLLLKNLRWMNVFFALPWLLVSGIARFVYMVLLEKNGFKVLFEVLKLIPTMLRKRRVIRRTSTTRARDLRRYFV